MIKRAILIIITISSWCFAIENGHPVGDSEEIARTTVTVNLMFVGGGYFPPVVPDPSRLLVCTGTIIDSDLVLTAAHCVKSYSAFHIIFGTHPGQAGVQKRSVRAFEVPLTYHYTGQTEETRFSDLALLYFNGGLPEGFQKANLSLEEISTSNALDHDLRAAGVGPCEDSRCTLTEAMGIRGSKVFLPDDLSVVFNGKAFPTKGDSGGPLFWTSPTGNRILGVCHGNVNVDGQGEELYTQVSHFSEWIKDASVRLRSTGLSRGPGWDVEEGGQRRIDVPCPDTVCPALVQVPTQGASPPVK